MPERVFPAIRDLIRQVEQATQANPDYVRLAADLTRWFGDQGADPYLLIGALLEGAVHTLVQHVPPEKQGEAAWAAVQVLLDRLRAQGLLAR
jgi:hypothetical protein